MSIYKKIAEEALKKINETNNTSSNKKLLNEDVLYPNNMRERMNPKLVKDIVNQKTSLGKHPIFPEGHEHSFEEKIMGERFSDVVKQYKKSHDVDIIDNNDVINQMQSIFSKTTELESTNKKELEELAIKLIREEYDIDEDLVEIHAELTDNINLEGTKKNPSPIPFDIDFKNHAEMVNANKEVYKRRFINAMIQGASMNCIHMYHMVDNELSDINPKLINLYTKLMSSADYMYYIIDKMDDGVTGGKVRIEFPTKDNPKPVIHAQGMVFPVLVLELVKGVMEIISAKGLPKKEIGEYVISKADFLSAEPWDMRIGAALWSRFTNLLDAGDFGIKHLIFDELVMLPVDEFNDKMKEIMAGTKEGKKIIKDISGEINKEIKYDEFNQSIKDGEDEDYGFDIDELLSNDDDNEDDMDGFDLEELF